MLGTIRLLEVADPLLAFERSYEGQTVLAVFNLGRRLASLTLVGMALAEPLWRRIVCVHLSYLALHTAITALF